MAAHYKSYKREYELVHKGLMTMEGGVFSLLSMDADFHNIVHLTKGKKTKWMGMLGSKSRNPAGAFDTYLARLLKKDMLVRQGVGVVMLNPIYRDKQNNEGSAARLLTAYQNCKSGCTSATVSNVVAIR